MSRFQIARKIVGGRYKPVVKSIYIYIHTSNLFPRRLRQPNQRRLANHRLLPVLAHIHHRRPHRFPAVSQIQRQPFCRGLDVGACVVAVGEVETGFYEEGAEAFAVVGGVHGEDFEDFGGGVRRGLVVWEG